MSQSDSCDYIYSCQSNHYCYKINNRDRKSRSLAFKSNTPFIGCISKSSNVLIGNAGNLGVVMPKHNLVNTVKQQVVYGIITEIN